MIPPFPYVLLHDRLGRKGQRCRIVKPGRIVMVEFEDGFRSILSRMALRRTYGSPTEKTAS